MKKVILPLMTIALAFLSTYCRSADDAADAQAQKIAGDFFQAYAKTFASGDAKAIAACWKSDGEIVDPEGMRIIGRDAIEKILRGIFQRTSRQQSDDRIAFRQTGWRGRHRGGDHAENRSADHEIVSIRWARWWCWSRRRTANG